jgi:hypothetical protein
MSPPPIILWRRPAGQAVHTMPGAWSRLPQTGRACQSTPAWLVRDHAGHGDTGCTITVPTMPSEKLVEWMVQR